MSGGLLDWLAAPSGEGLRFLSEDGAWTPVSYAELAKLVRTTAWELKGEGLATGDVVIVLHRTGPAFAASFFGVLAAGGAPSPLAPPAALGDMRRWIDHATHVISESGAVMVLADPDLADVVSVASPHCRVVLPPLLPHDQPLSPAPPAEPALLQFTSGSRGRVRGVRVSWSNLEANIAMIERRWVWPGGGTGVSWLPLHHDLGLVFGLLVPVIRQTSVGLMRPEQFVQRPLQWLREYDGRSGALMLMPAFGLEYLARRVRPAQLEGLDLSGVHAVVTGAERIRPDAAAAFLELLRPCGLAPSAFKPAYGLAEATLGVTCVRPDATARVVAVADEPVRMGEPLPIVAETTISRRPDERTKTWYVSCGSPLDDLKVQVVGDSGTPLPDGCLGEITVSGPSVAMGHTRVEDGDATRFEDGVLFTGDAGFFLDDELYVVGRIGDSLQVRGRNVYVEDLESALAGQGLFARHRTVVLAGHIGAVPNVWVVTTVPSAEDIIDCLTPLVGPDVAIRVLKVRAAALAWTSSGKPRRRSMWRRVLAGELDGQVLAESAPLAARP